MAQEMTLGVPRQRAGRSHGTRPARRSDRRRVGKLDQARFARLRQKYSSRIKSPIAELGFCGIAAGAAMAGSGLSSISAPQHFPTKPFLRSSTRRPLLTRTPEAKPTCR